MWIMRPPFRLSHSNLDFAFNTRVMEGGRPYGSTATTLATHVRPL